MKEVSVPDLLSLTRQQSGENLGLRVTSGRRLEDPYVIPTLELRMNVECEVHALASL